MTFLHPHLLWLLLLLPVLLLIYVLWRRKQQASLRMPSLHFLDGIGGGVRVYLRHSVFALRLLALGLIIIALARPQSSSSWYLHEYARYGLPAQSCRSGEGSSDAFRRQSP